MAKRIFATFFIVLGCCFLMLAIMFVVLLLAPGLSVLGIKYLRLDTHVVNTGKVSIAKYVDGSFSGSITLETNEIPVTVYFSEDQNDALRNNGFYFEYYDNYQGFTSSEFDDPSYSITKDLVGNVTIKINEFERLLFESSSSKRYVKLYVPLVYVDKDEVGQRVDLTINAGKASVTFVKEDETDLRIPTFANINLKTNGDVAFNTNVYALTYKYETNNSIEIGENSAKGIDAQNLNLLTHKGSITIKRPIEGDITAQTKNRNIKMVSCRNLNATTSYGNITRYGEGKINTSGLVNITTTSGNVTLGQIDGTGKNKIVTSSGSVNIDSIGDGSLSTSSGSIRIKILNKFDISSNVGKVIVEEAKESVNVSTKRGNIVLGGEGMVLANAKAYSRLGSITLINASGTVDLQTNKKDIVFKNGTSEYITISSGGKLSATNLKGIVTINSAENASLEFERISDTTKIILGDMCTSVQIKALKNTIINTKYIFSGQNVTIWESNGEGSGTYSKKDVGANLGNETILVGEYPYINVTGKNADIQVYFDTSVTV